MGHNSAQDQTSFQEVQGNSASPAQVENQKDLMEEEASSNRQILEKQSLAQQDLKPAGYFFKIKSKASEYNFCKASSTYDSLLFFWESFFVSLCFFYNRYL